MKRWSKEEGVGKRYKEIKREYKVLCENKKKEELERWEKEVSEAKIEEQVWKVVNRERKRRRRLNERIKMEKGDEYFRGLLGGVEWKTVCMRRRKRGRGGWRRKAVMGRVQKGSK